MQHPLLINDSVLIEAAFSSLIRAIATRRRIRAEAEPLFQHRHRAPPAASCAGERTVHRQARAHSLTDSERGMRVFTVEFSAKANACAPLVMHTIRAIIRPSRVHQASAVRSGFSLASELAGGDGLLLHADSDRQSRDIRL